MSDSPVEGWKRASDGRWYPPGRYRPGYAASPLPPVSVEDTLDVRSIIPSLFDFRFQHLVAPRLIRLVYVVVTVIYSVVAVVYFILSLIALVQGHAVGFIGIIITPIIYLLYLILARVVLEILVIIFRMADDLRAIRTAQGN